MRSRAARSALVGMLAALALCAAAAGGQPAPDPEAASALARLGAAHEALADARARLERAETAYQDWRQRKHPRGAAKEALVAEVDAAREALERAAEDYPRAFGEARRAGVAPGDLRRYPEPE